MCVTTSIGLSPWWGPDRAMMSCFSGNSVFRQVNSMCLMPRWRCWRSRCARFPRCESAQIRFCFHSNQNLFLLEPESVSTWRMRAWRKSLRSIFTLRWQKKHGMASWKLTYHAPRMPIIRNNTKREAHRYPNQSETTRLLSEPIQASPTLPFFPNQDSSNKILGS